MKRDYSMYSPETQSKLAEYTSKILNNTITKEEYIDAIRRMRDERMSAVPTTKKAKAKAPKKSGAEVLAAFMKPKVLPGSKP